MLLLLCDVLLFHAQEGSVLVDLSRQNALLGLRIETGRDILEESEIGLQLLNQLISVAQCGCSLLDSLELSETIGNSFNNR